MSDLMYAIFFTNSKLLSSFNPSLKNYNRRQSRGFTVDVIVDVDDDKVKVFQELANVKLRTNDEFQGTLTVN